jgi:hypothetical protein
MLQKCAYAMISQQELSGQQVASYLMDFEDHFTSHSYRNLYWTAFEGFINRQLPSPECYPVRKLEETPESTEQPPEEPLGESQLPEPQEKDESNGARDEEECDETPFFNELFDEYGPDENHVSDADHEVGVSIDGAGNLVPIGDQLGDYHKRGPELNDVCVWDFIARIDKVNKNSDKRKHREKCNEDGDDEYLDDLDGLKDAAQEDEGTDDAEEPVLQVESRARPRIGLQKGHDQADSHILRVRSPSEALIPVPIGPGIPRRDKAELRARYCRLMLIFFKPWRQASDLRGEFASWQAAFEAFVQTCTPQVLYRMENMQILHECRDSRDDHFAEHRNRVRKAVNSRNRRRRAQDGDDFSGEDVTEAMILDHLEDLTTRFSMKRAAANEAILECVHYAEESGMYSAEFQDNSTHDPSAMSDATGLEGTHLVTDTYHEDIWGKAYEERRDRFKRSASTPNKTSTSDASLPEQNSTQTSTSLLNDGAALRSAFAEPDEAPEIRQDIEASEPLCHVDIETHIEKWTLNPEQAAAFRIIASHSLQNQPEQLRMFLSGPGGTGKSRVIHALQDFFRLRGQERRFRLAAYTGVAARNINGMTLHSSLCISQRTSKSTQTRTRRDLIAMWEGVDYLFIDEVSMVGCAFLLQISEALTEAKGNTSPFGGVNIIFAGDFAQLPPVGEKRLYATINTSSESASGKRGQKDIMGKLLWFSVKTVVVLKRIERVRRKRNEVTGELEKDQEAENFVALLGRLREGSCTDEDFETLNSRLITRVRPDWTESRFRNIPIIVSSNELKDALNIKASNAYAARTGQSLNWYHAVDTRSDGTLVSDPMLREHLLSKLHSGQTNYRLGRLPLAIGMPVMITQNFDVQSGIVNGTTGIVKQIRYSVNDSGEKIAQSCIVYIPEMTGPPLPNLPPKHAAVLAETVDMTFTHPDSHKKCVMKRTQLPLVPAFAMTAHKAQGKTMEAIVVDLESTHGTEAPYVMISRATSLAGVFILRPFRQKVIQCRPSQDVRNEFKRLDMLSHQTRMKHGSAEEALESREYLVKNFSPAALPTSPREEQGKQCLRQDARALARLQASSARLISGPPSAPEPPRARRPRNVRTQAVIGADPMHVEEPPMRLSSRGQKRRGGEENPAAVKRVRRSLR